METISSEGRIFHITENYSPANPGVTTVITQLTRYLTGKGRQAAVLTAGKAGNFLSQETELLEFPIGRHNLAGWRYPEGMESDLTKLAGRGPIFHIHGVWFAPQWLAARIARQNRIPAILTSHCQYAPWHWRDGSLRRIKKLAYWFTLAFPAFRHLPVFHAITPDERDDLRQHFPRGRFEVIPNAIDLQEADLLLSQADDLGLPALDGPYLLFLGRLHPKKGADILISAFAQSLQGRNFRLVLVGPEDNTCLDYTAKLKSQVRLLGLEKKVTFSGPIFGPQKWRLYRDAWAFCAPSHSEVMGLVNLEAAATATPVVTTHETGLFDWEEGGGLLVHPRVEELAKTLDQVFSWSDRERQDRGRQLRQLVERRYSWEAVGPQWLRLYDDLLERF